MGSEELLLDRAKKEGITKGKAEEKADFARNLLLSTDFSTKRIAELVLSEASVKKAKASLQQVE